MPVEADLSSNFSSEHVNIENTDSCLPLCSSCTNCISYSTDMKKIKSDIAVIQKQIKSSNNVIESTNSIINSVSSLLETLLKEFNDKLNVKNEEIEKRDRIIEGLQDKISKLEEERNHSASVLITHESLRDEALLDNGQGLPQPNNANLHANHVVSQKLFPDRVGTQDLLGELPLIEKLKHEPKCENETHRGITTSDLPSTETKVVINSIPCLGSSNNKDNNKVNRPNNTRLVNVPPKQ